METDTQGVAEPQTTPEFVQSVGDQVTAIVNEVLHSRTEQPITDPTPIADIRGLFEEPLPGRA